MAADFIAVNIDKPSFAGAQSDPVAALILCEANIVDYSFIHGRKVVDQGQLTVTDLGSLTARTHNLAKELLCS